MFGGGRGTGSELLFLRGGVGNLHVGEFILADGADGVGIYRSRN